MTSPVASTKPPTASWKAPYYVKGLALGIPPYLVAIHFWTWIFTLSVFLSGRADFRSVYTAGYMVRTGHAHELYDYNVQKAFQDKLISREDLALPFLNPAYHALLFVPLSLFPYKAAYFLFLLLNLSVLAACIALLRPWSHNLHTVFPWLPLSLALGFLPVGAALIQGQSSILLTGLLVGVFVLLNKKLEFAAGILSALGLIKLQIIIPIALLFFFWRRWRYVFGFAACSIVLALASAWFTGFSQTKVYLQSLMSIAGPMSPNSGFIQHPNLMANIRGVVLAALSSRTSSFSLQAIVIVLSVTVFAWTATLGLRTRNAADQLLMAIPCGVLIGHHTYIHDLSVLLLPSFVLLDRFLPCEPAGSRNQRLIVRSAALMFAAPVMESFFANHFYLVSIAVLILLAATIHAATEESCTQLYPVL
jgi:hypothetical protein